MEEGFMSKRLMTDIKNLETNEFFLCRFIIIFIPVEEALSGNENE